MKRVLSWVTTGVLIVVLGVALLVTFIPRIMGGTSLTVLTGSMLPAIQPGDMVVTRAVNPSEIRIGDVITFMPNENDPTLVTHRVVAKGLGREITWTTRGDANDADDKPLVAGQIVGKVMYVIPRLGWASAWLGNYRQWALWGLAGVLVLYALAMLFRKDGSKVEPEPVDVHPDGETTEGERHVLATKDTEA